MDAQQLDAVVRVVGVTLLTLTAVRLFGPGKKRLALCFAPLALCLSGFLIGNTGDTVLRLHGLIAAAAHLVSGYSVVFLWWFCLSLFDRAFVPRGPVLAVGLAWLLIASIDRGVFGPALADKGLSWVLVAIGFVIVAHLAWRLVQDRDGDLIEERRDVRLAVVLLLASLLFVELSKEVVFGLDWRPWAFTLAENAAVAAFGLWMSALTLRTGDASLAAAQAPLAAAPPAVGPSWAAGDAGGQARLAERVRHLIEVEHAHLEPELTFDAFVRRTGASERAVRAFINQRLGYDHFRSFLNAQRTAEARRLLTDPARAEDKLVAIALDSGFASVASFNRAFRASEGCAPSTFRRAAAEAGLRPALRRLDPAFEERSAGF